MKAALGWRWLPLVSSVVATALILVLAGTSIADVARYVGYAVYAVILPGTLVFRALRRRPHTFVEDVTFGAAVGLVLELAAWALLSAMNLRALIMFWPLLVMVPFVAVRVLRRHWRVDRYPAALPNGWSWSMAGSVVFFAIYLYGAFYAQNPIVPVSDQETQFLDLAYQLSLAGEAKHQFPLDLPQVAGEPLQYHWFSFAHLAMSSMIGGIDLPVVTMRLMVIAICALTGMLTAIVGWRLTGRAWAGVAAAVMFLVIGDFDFAAAGWPPFGSQVTFVTWPSLSMTYSWAILVALIGTAGDLIRTHTDESGGYRLGPGAYVLTAMFALASSASKASSLPVVLAALALAGLAALIRTRKIPWRIVTLGLIVGLAQLLALAVVFAFNRYGLTVTPLAAIKGYWAQYQGPRGPIKQGAVMAAVGLAFLLHLQLRAAGIVPLVWLRRGRLNGVQWFLLGGAIAGPAFHLLLSGYSATWFTRAGFPFSLLLSAWGYALVFERANLGRSGKTLLAIGSAVFATGLTAVSLVFAGSAYPVGRTYSQLLPILWLAAGLASLGAGGAVVWFLIRRRRPALRGRGPVVALTVILLAGIAGFPLDIKANWGVPGGAYGIKVPVPQYRAEAARWVRDHSDPRDVIATNSHCAFPVPECEVAQSFWLSGYSERSVLVEGWAFAPRIQNNPAQPFWDRDLFALNERAFYTPTAAVLDELFRAHGVRYLVVARDVLPESGELRGLARLRFDNGKVAVYELTG